MDRQRHFSLFGFGGFLVTGGLALLFAALGSPAPLSAQSQWEVPRDQPGQYQIPDEAQAAIDQLKSPYCPGLMLEVCPSPGGAALRDSIITLSEEGMTADELVEWVIGNHGEEWRAMPKAEGNGLLAWIVPPAGAALGLLVVILALKALKKQRVEVAPMEGELSPEEEARLREAMRELDKEEEATFF